MPIQKRRLLRLEAGKDADIERICRHIGKMPGVSSVGAGEGGLVVEYDLQQITLAQIEAAATAEGLRFKGGMHGFRRDMWKYTERNELENAARRDDGACCNRPPPKVR